MYNGLQMDGRRDGQTQQSYSLLFVILRKRLRALAEFGTVARNANCS